MSLEIEDFRLGEAAGFLDLDIGLVFIGRLNPRT
jgi:hypothetical protein